MYDDGWRECAKCGKGFTSWDGETTCEACELAAFREEASVRLAGSPTPKAMAAELLRLAREVMRQGGKPER